MKFASIRDVRNQPGLLQSTRSGEPVTLTTNGRPFALVVGLDTGEDPGELEALIRRARAQRAISRIRAWTPTWWCPASSRRAVRRGASWIC